MAGSKGDSDNIQVPVPRAQRGFKASSQGDVVIALSGEGTWVPGCRRTGQLTRPLRATVVPGQGRRGIGCPLGGGGQDRCRGLTLPDLRWSPEALWVVLGDALSPESSHGRWFAHRCPVCPTF